jgi:hypothetical protein
MFATTNRVHAALQLLPQLHPDFVSVCFLVKDQVGVQNYLNNNYSHSQDKVGVLIAGNSGLPGGAVYYLLSSSYSPRWEYEDDGRWAQFSREISATLDKAGQNSQLTVQINSNKYQINLSTMQQTNLHTKFTRRIRRGDIGSKVNSYNTQEEDVIVDWLLTEQNINSTSPENTFGRIKSAWGMQDLSGNDTTTRQRIDYTTAQPWQYGDAWVVDNAPLAKKDGDRYDFRNKKSVTLVFVAGPNVGACGRRNIIDDQRRKITGNNHTSTTRRTFNFGLRADFRKFLEGVKAAYYAGLCSMVNAECKIALLCHVSGGIYAGLFRDSYGDGSDYSLVMRLINEVLKMPYSNYNTQTHQVERLQQPLYTYFREVKLVCKGKGE